MKKIIKINNVNAAEMLLRDLMVTKTVKSNKFISKYKDRKTVEFQNVLAYLK